MENNEIMDVINMDDNVVADGGTGMGTGVAMLVGAGLAFAVGAGVNLAKKGIAALKARKEINKPDEFIEVDETDVAKVAAK
jgi:hypothetical protein